MTALTERDLGPLADDPRTLRLSEEQRELFRIAAQSALDRSCNGARLDPDARAWAKRWASLKPLGRALSDGSGVAR